MTHFQFVSGGDELTTIPEGHGGFQSHGVNDGGGGKHGPAQDDVQFVIRHNNKKSTRAKIREKPSGWGLKFVNPKGHQPSLFHERMH